MGLVAALAARCFSTSPKICCLPVRNIRVPGEFWRIWLSESKSFARWLAGHSSKASMHINVRWEIISCKNSTISASTSLWRPMTLLLSRKAFTIACGTSLRPPATCFSNEPGISARDCSSLWEVEVEARNRSVFAACLHNVSITSELRSWSISNTFLSLSMASPT